MGCELLGGTDWGAVDEDAAIAAVRTAVDLGVTVFDTADVYGLGRSESVLARALGRDMSKVVVITKGGIAWSRDQESRALTRRDLSPQHLRSAVEGSLRRLRIEQIPLYLAHWPEPGRSVEDVVASLATLKDLGLIGAYGLSNFAFEQLKQASSQSPIDAIEIQHSLVNPHTALAQAFAPTTTVLTYGALGQGLLTGKYPPGHEFPVTDRRHRLEHFRRAHQYRELLGILQTVAAEADITPAQAAIRWTLASAPNITVVGARNPEQVRNNVIATSGVLGEKHQVMLTQAAG